MNPVKVRFAPSPTGYLHVGGARTALFNWLFARSAGGKFILRIEDTDTERSSEEMVTAILDSMKWLGLNWDEEPYFQSSGLERHRNIAVKLVDQGRAYPCFCKAEGSGEKTYLYPKTCLKLSADERQSRIKDGESFAVRFNVPGGKTEFRDLVYGSITVDHKNIDDFVLLRTDGSPTYQLAVVADDVQMGITHVIRGDDHLSNTPKQILLYKAMDEQVPDFAHLPLILGPDKKRLSKRHGATAITSYQEMGFLSQSVVNFLALLGWSPGDDVEMIPIDRLKEIFSLERVTKKSAVFDIQKLEWLNGRYLSEIPTGDLFDEATGQWIKAGLLEQGELEKRKTWLLELIDLLKSRARLFSDFTDLALPFLTAEYPFEEKAVKKRWKQPREVIKVLNAVTEELNIPGDFSAPEIEEKVRGVAIKLEVSNSRVFHPVRVALTGRLTGPSLFELMAVLGKETVLQRFARAVTYLIESSS